MRIDLIDLKNVIDRLFDHIINTRGVKFCEFDKDNYWNVPSPDIYEADEPSSLDIGSLSDDWEFLSYLLDQEKQPVAYQLTELAPIIRYLGDHLGKKLASKGG